MDVKGIMQKEDIIYCVIINCEKWEKKHIGNKEIISPKGLIDMADNEEYLRNLVNSLDGQILPTHWGQGDVEMLVCNPKREIVVLFFYYAEDDVLAEYEKGERIDKMLKKIDYDQLCL